MKGVKQIVHDLSEVVKSTADGTAISAWIVSLTGVLSPLISLVIGITTLVWLGYRIEDLVYKRKQRK